MKVLVTASETVSADRLPAALGRATDDVEIMVVAPALHRSALRFGSPTPTRRYDGQDWCNARQSGLEDAGLDAHGDSGEGEPVKAVEDVLVTFPAERTLLFTRLFQTGATTRASTVRHCSNGLACRPNRLNEQPDMLSVQRRQVMRRVSHL